MKSIGTIVFLGFFLLPVFAQPPVSKKKFCLYLLVGQSNMAGRAKVEAADTMMAKNVWMLTQANEWKPAREPLHFDKPDVAGTGPGLAFGKAMAAGDSSLETGLIPCAVGGTCIRVWEKGKYDSATRTHPYDDAIKRAKAAMRNGRLKGILWQQGESDSDSVHAKGYDEKLQALVKNFREDLQQKEVPFFAGTIAEFYVYGHPFALQINQAIEALPAKVKNAVVVSSAGLVHKGDHTHFDAASARELGKRYAAAVKGFYKKK